MIPVSKPSIGEKELNAVNEVFKTGWLGLGAVVKQFEDEVKKYLGCKHVIAVNTGTSALHIALDGYGISKGDEVIVPSLTFAASIQAIIMCGASPVFCDIDENTLNIDINDVKKKVTGKTKAIMPVHYSGLSCGMDELLKIAGKNNAFIIEDAAHAFGSVYKGKKIGSFGDASCFSFDPIKTITCGEGGAVTTNDDDIAKRIQQKRILGINKETWLRYKNKRAWVYEVVTEGFRYHMSNINAAIGLEQMKKIDEFIEGRRNISKKYDDAFRKVKGLRLIEKDYDNMAPFNYIIRIDKDRDKLMDLLKESGVGSGVHYIPNHTQPFFKEFYSKLPVTEKISGEILTLPLYFDMSDKDVVQVIESVIEGVEE